MKAEILVCERAQVREDDPGRFDAHGLAIRGFVPDAPGAPPTFRGKVVVLVRPEFGELGDHTVRVVVSNPDRAELTTVTGHVTVTEHAPVPPLVLPLSIQAAKLGPHKCAVEVDGVELAAYTLMAMGATP